jgi:predicted dehydrogenase
MLQWLMGGVKSVTGVVKTVRHNIEVEDMGTVLVEYNNGAMGVLEVSTAIEPGYMERMEIHGEKGTIIMDKGNILEWKVEGCQEKDYLEKQYTATGQANSPAVSYINHKHQLEEILSAIIRGQDPLVTGEEGIKALDIVLAIYESSAKRQRIYLQEH